MALFNLSKKYNINSRCDNCSKICLISIPKGITVGDAIKDKILRCDYCGCNIKVEEYETEWSMKHAREKK